METTTPTKFFRPTAKPKSTSSNAVLSRVGLACLTYGISGFLIYTGFGSSTPLQGAALFFGLALLSWALPAFYAMLLSHQGDNFVSHSSISMLLGGSFQIMGLLAVWFFESGASGTVPINFAFNALIVTFGFTLVQNLLWGFRKGNSIVWGLFSASLLAAGLLTWFCCLLSYEEMKMVYSAIF